jgi:phosphoribosylamine-glycine ligase
VTASGADLRTAIDGAYEGVKRIEFAGMHFRTDIGRKGMRAGGGLS